MPEQPLKNFLYVPANQDYSTELVELLAGECNVLTARTVQEVAAMLQGGQPFNTLFMDTLNIPTNKSLAKFTPDMLPSGYTSMQYSLSIPHASPGLGLLVFARRFHKNLKSGITIQHNFTDAWLFTDLAYALGATLVSDNLDDTPEFIRKNRERLI